MEESDFVVVHWEGRTDVALGLVRLPSEVDVDLATLRAMVENQVEAIALQRGSGAGRDWDYRFLMPNRGAVAVASDRMEKGRVGVVGKKTRVAHVPIGRKQEIEMFLSDLLVGSPDNVGPSIVLRSVKASDADKPADSKPDRKKSRCVFKTVVGLMIVAAFFVLAFHWGLSAHGPHHPHDDHHPGQQTQPQPPHPWWNAGGPGQVAYAGDGGAYPGGGGVDYGDRMNYDNPMPVYGPPPEQQVAILIIEEVQLPQQQVVMPMEDQQINGNMPADWPVMSPEDAWAGAPSSEASDDMGWKSEEASSYAAVDLPAPIDRRRYLRGNDQIQIQIDVPELMVIPREELPNMPTGDVFVEPPQFPPPPQYHVDPVPPREYGRDIYFVDAQQPKFLIDPMTGGEPWAHPGSPGGLPWAHPGGPGGHHGGHHDGHHHGDHHGYRLIERVALAIVYTVGSSVDGYFRTFVTCWAEMGTWLVRLIDAYFALLQNLIDHMLVWPVVVVLVVGMAVALHYAERIIAAVLPYKGGDLKLAADPEEDLARVDDLVDEECPKLKD